MLGCGLAVAEEAEADQVETAASRDEISEAQGIVSVIMGVICRGVSMSRFPGAAAGAPACADISLSAPSEFDDGAVGHASTTVVVMGTFGSGISVHPQCSIVTVVVRHVSVRVGQVTESSAQIVV